MTISAGQLLQGASGADGLRLSVSNLVVDGGGTLGGPDDEGNYTYTPPKDFNGTVKLSYEVSDGTTGVAQTAAVEVVPVADTPALAVTLGPGTGEGGAAGGSTGVGGGGDTSLGLDISLTEPDSYDIVGTGDSDFVKGGAGGQAIDGGGGGDVLYGDFDLVDSGEDFIKGGEGNDQITGGDSADSIMGGEGNDTIYGDFQSPSPNPGDDVIVAGAGNDTVIAGDGDDSISGGSGDDLIQGDFDWETAGGNDRIDAGSGNDTVIGGAGDDVLYGDYRWMTASGGDDIIAGGRGDDSISGGPGTDIAVFAGSRFEYEIRQEGDVFVIVDLVPGRDGTDRVQDVEIFRFVDGDIPFTDLLTNTGSNAAAGGDVSYPLDITAALSDTFGSERLSDVAIDMSGVPAGVIFSAGTLVSGQWIVSADELHGLTMTVPAGAPVFSLSISVTSTETVGGDSRTTAISVDVDAARQEAVTVSGGEAVVAADVGISAQEAAPMLAAVEARAAFTAFTAEAGVTEGGAAEGGIAEGLERTSATAETAGHAETAAATPGLEPTAAESTDAGGVTGTEPAPGEGETDQGEASTVDPVQLYQELAAGYQAPEADDAASQAGEDVAEDLSGQVAPLAGDDADTDAGSIPAAPDSQSAIDDYLTLAQARTDDGEPAAVPDDAPGQDAPGGADYAQFAADVPSGTDDPGLPPPDQVEVSAADVGVDDLPAFQPPDDGSAGADLPDQPIMPDQDDQTS